MNTPTQSPAIVKRRPLELRVGRVLVKTGRILARVYHHSSISIRPAAQYALLNHEKGTIEGYVDLEPLAEELGCIRPGEVAQIETAETMSRPRGHHFE